ncbi:MAG: hypothetical protein LBL16_04560 [Endomicrobium sp.]|nr:hypothetical protein [Endomicrobium sp.]
MIIPWISLWLIFYEIFEITGEWTGGGISPILQRVCQNSNFEQTNIRK